MPRACTVCHHPQREKIDRALVAGEPNRRIGAQTGLAETSIRRHRESHLPKVLVAAHDVEAVANADNLLDQVKDLHRRTLAILSSAELEGDHALALRSIREARKQPRAARPAGRRAETETRIVLTGAGARAALVTVLTPFPEARAAVSAALLELEA